MKIASGAEPVALIDPQMTALLSRGAAKDG
jgi:hypothetical protein